MRIRTAAQRHRSQERRAEAEREAGIPDRADADFRTACLLEDPFNELDPPDGAELKDKADAPA